VKTISSNTGTGRQVHANDRLVCVAVADLPVASVPSFRDACGACGTAVWRSNLSAALHAVPECLLCAGDSLRALRARGENPVVRAAPYFEEDLARWRSAAS
jgi:hypothetical protein